MSSVNETIKLPDEVEPRKTDWPVAGARMHPDQLRLVDVARAYTNENRSEFMAEAAIERARAVLEREAPGMLEHVPAA